MTKSSAIASLYVAGALSLSPSTVRAHALDPVAAPNSVVTHASETPSGEAERRAHASWKKRRNGLAAGVGVSAGLLTAGALTAGLSLYYPLCRFEQSCTDVVDPTPQVTGLVLAIGGGIALVTTASLLGHHQRWHRPSASTSTDELTRARQRTRGLTIGVVISATTVAAGAIAFAAGLAGDREVPGVIVGTALMSGGGLSTLATGTLLGLHRAHRHERARQVALTPGIGGFSMRF